MRFTRTRNEDGVALITVIMMLSLISAMLVATTVLVVKDQRARFQDHNRTDTFYVAHAGLEKVTNDLGRVFSTNYSPTATDLANVTASPPALGGMQFVLPGGAAGSGYKITQKPEVDTTIATGPFAGLEGMITPYVIDVTARSPQGSEVSLRREVNTIAIPVFQFGIFSETDLSFFPGPEFNFGGRVHTNGNLWLAKGNTDDLILADRVTAVGNVVRHQLANGVSTDPGYMGEVRILTTDNGCDVSTTATTCRPMARTEGSLTIAGAINNEWPEISDDDYGGFIKNGTTGAARLTLPITSGGTPPIELIRRPSQNEDTTNNNLYIQRYYSLASVRILLSDEQTDLSTLPGKAENNGVDLGARGDIAKAGASGAGLPYKMTAGDPLVTGFLKVEMQNQAGTDWEDVTGEFLAAGYTGRSLGADATACSPANWDTAIIRIQRIKDTPVKDAPPATTCNDNFNTNRVPNTLYDEREGAIRDNNATAGLDLYMGGVMHYVELDIRNLRLWLAAKRAGDDIMETTGYVVYFSDRRGNKPDPADGRKKGEYGFEDVVYSDGALNTGEDINGNTTLQSYGGTANTLHSTGMLAPFFNGTPYTVITADGTATAADIARSNRTVLFRRALKLVNGDIANMRIDDAASGPKLGLTVVSENPVYIHGDYNADTDAGQDGNDVPLTYGHEHVACAVIADAVTLLSNNWSDKRSFEAPHRPAGRKGYDTTYRTAIVSGKGLAFPHPGIADDFGTDGGTHNFLRYLEDWDGTLYYRGSIVSLYYNHQATGTYKCCVNVYGPPTRKYSFDEEFLDSDLLPPRTPMFRTIDVTNFTRLSEPPTP